MRDKWWKSARLAGAIALPVATASIVIGPGGLAGHAETYEVPVSRPAWATPAADHGPAAGDAPVEARIWFAARDRAGLSRYVRAVSSPRDPLYRHFLSPREFHSRFGPTAAQMSSITSWASSQGLRVTGETDHYVTVSGSVVKTQKALSVSLHSFSGNGRAGIAPVTLPRIPRRLAPAVLTVTGLDHETETAKSSKDLPPPPKNRWWPKRCSSGGEPQEADFASQDGNKPTWVPCSYTPEQLRAAYGADRRRLNGHGVTVAVVNAYSSPTMATDLARYSRDHHIPLNPGQYREVLSPTWDQMNTCGAPGWYSEQAKDVEAVHAMASDAGIVYVGAQNCTTSALNDALVKVVDQRLADIVSCSWGSPTDGYPVQDRLVAHSIFEQGAAEGIGFYVSSGDAGYEDPATSAGHGSGSRRLQVDYPASDPMVTAVGGTSLMLNANNSYAYETSWGQYRIKLAEGGTNWTAPPPGRYPQDWSGGSGGGTSIMYEQPWYQAAVVPTALSRGLPGGRRSAKPMRVVPDVALDADPLTGMTVGETVRMPDGKTLRYTEGRSGGTSLSCPLFAGIQALVQQAQHGRPLGFANPAIYLRYGTSAYNDVTDTPLGPNHTLSWVMRKYTDQRNAKGPLLTYLATTGHDGEGAAALRADPGYDNTTGVGSPNRHYLDSYQ
ncbi:S53 family peptidase [Streptomyces sp. NPDC046915]|uniref:S53 family peptidase n=1 Tax=Streptomyces sp. NPDC046915 TaxID=3155257 RepID=UPI0033E093CD